MLDTGPAGTLAASSRSSQAAVVAARSLAARSSRSASRWAMRSALDLKRGSSASSSSPITRTSRIQLIWFQPPTVIQPSDVGRASYGAASGCAEPRGPGDSPVASATADCQKV